MRQFVIQVDHDPEGDWEASCWFTSDPMDQFYWASSDPFTLMAAIARDMAKEVQ